MFGDKLKELRKNNNISQEKLGEYLNVTSTAIYSWEINRTQPSIENIVKIADFFNVTTDYLLGFNQEDFHKTERLQTALKEAGINNLEKAMQILEILKEDKDTEK